MSLLRQIQRFGRNRLLGGGGRVAAAALMLAAGLAQPGWALLLAAPSVAAPAVVAPLAPQVCPLVVTSTSDNVAGSLRAGVNCATSGQTVTFSAALAHQTVNVTAGDIAVVLPITIDASAAPGVIVDAGNTSRVFNITTSGAVILKGMVLQRGHAASGNGGALLAGSATALTLNQVQVLSSTAPAGGGGGLYTTFTAILTGTQFISNSSSLAGGGAVVGGAVLLMNSRFERNTCTGSACQAGGLGVVGALTVTSTDFISNTSAGPGGGIYAVGAVVLTNGSFQGNNCTESTCRGGGLTALTTLTLAGTQFISNTSVAAAGGALVEGTAVLANASFQGNKCTGSGCEAGGLGVAGVLTVTSTDFISNTSTSHGGGIYAASDALLTGGRFERNTCTQSGCQGGGLSVAGALTVTGTDFISNTSVLYGGGVAVAGAALVTNGQFEGNKCTDNVNSCAGGGLAAGSGLTITGTDFINNTSIAAAGGVYALGSSELINDRFDGNRCTQANCMGGGLGTAANSDVRGSSFSGNQSAGGGGALAVGNSAQITLANVTLSGNMATVAGGGLFAVSGGHANLFNVTVADNQAPSGGGLLVQPGATAGISNTIFSNNGADNCSGTIANGTHNLEWPGGTCATAGPSAGFTSANLYLAPLALNPPGTTLTRALLIGSPARDHGDPATCANTPVNNVDQRGVARPIDSDLVPGAICDIGAYEAGRPFLFLPLVRR